MVLATTVAVGVVSGLHAALYGAYKDSPHESFIPRRFIREIAIATGVACTLGAFHLADGQSPFVVYVSVFALARIVTEFWKLFLRVEPQDGFRIPTQVHWLKTPVQNTLLRVAIGLGWLAGIYGCYALFRLIPRDLPNPLVGLLVGGGIGLGIACCGGYKDGTIEGFSWMKFAKSPTFGALGGLIVALHTTSLAYLLLGSVGTERMINELAFKILRPGYVPGKFPSLVARFPEWEQRRRRFLVPYAATWVLLRRAARRGPVVGNR